MPTVLQSACFNSILVRLKVGMIWTLAKMICSFNSILVRLKGVVELDKPSDSLYKFQFHTGSIKSFTLVCMNNRIRVSIPYWFD